MDYDENDFQSHNLHLASEESAKSPPVLSLYALPKFDFDDTLQGHLRFDSLDETEVFLGIESNEDNQWIEDFSHGNSGIEFSSSAAESCSVARRNNVWSEATSSESVEMLLKSVGQEEIILVQGIVNESDAGDELVLLAKQMEPSLKHDSNISSRIEDATDLQPTLLEDEIPGSLSKLKDNAEEKHPGVEDSSEMNKCETSIDRISNDQDPNVVSANYGLPLTDGSLATDGKCENVEERHINSSIGEFQENRMLEHASTMKMLVDNVVVSTHNTVTTCGDSRNQEMGHVINDISDQKGSGVQSENGAVPEFPVPDKSEVESGVCNREDPALFGRKVEFGGKPNTGSRSISDVEEHSSMIVEGGSNSPIAERCSNAECSVESVKGDKYENIALYSGEVVENQSDITVQNISQATSEGDGIEGKVKVTALDKSIMASKDDGKFENQAIEFNGSNGTGCASLEPKTEPLVQTHGHHSFSMDKEVLFVQVCEMRSEDIASNSDASLLSMEENKFTKVASDGNINFHAGGDSSTLNELCSSAKLLQETHKAETLECTNVAFGVCNELVNAEHHGSSSMLVESAQICKEKMVPMQDDAHNFNLDGCDKVLDEKELPSHTLLDGEVESPLSGVSTDKKVVALNLHRNTTIVNNSDVTPENSDNDVCMKVDTVSSFSENVTSDDQNQAERSSPVLGFTHLDKKEDEKEEAANRRFAEKSEIVLDSETGKRLLLSDTGDQSNLERQDIPQTAVGNEVRQWSFKKLEAHPVIIESTEKEGDDATKNVFEKSVDVTVKENYEKATLKNPDAKIIPRTDEILAQSGPVFVEKTCCVADQNGSEEKEATVESGDKASENIVVSNTEGEGGSMHTDSNQPTCGSPTVIRAVQPSQSGKKEGVIGEGGIMHTDSDQLTYGSPDVIRAVQPSQSGKKEGVIGEGGSMHIDSDQPTCCSPTVIRPVQPSQSAKKERVKGSEVDDGPVSEVIEDACKIQPACKDSGGYYASKSDTSFTFEVSSLDNLSNTESGKSSQPLSTISPANVSPIVEVSPPIPGFRQRKPKVTQDVSHGSPKVTGGDTVHSNAKGTTERKRRRASPKVSGKETSKKGNLTKEGTPARKSEKGNKLSIVSLSPSGIGQLVPSKTVQLVTTTASLPDLNSSASPPSVFQQPFTDLQQVQLRAQIFVYGSLIQGVAPEETYMISAFGGPDGGKSTWESAWRAALERSRNQKSPSVNPETPLPPRSGAKASDQAFKESRIQSKGISTPAGRASSKDTPSNIVNPMIPPSSPLWSISTPDAVQSIVVPRGQVMDYRPALSPLHPYQTPPVRNFVAHNTWLPQPSFRGPWIASSQPSTVDTNAHFPLLPNMEPVQLTSAKEQSVTHSSGIMHLSPGPMVHTGGPSGVFPVTTPQLDMKKATVSPAKPSADTKPRKRKKVSNSEDPRQTVFLSQSQSEPLSAPAVSHLSGSLTITTPVGLVPKSTTEKVIMPVSPVSSTDHHKIGERHPELKAILSENFNKVKEAKLHAEEAAALAASAVNHCQEIWSQLDKQKCSGLVSDVEAKLASAAVAVAAAASVAKAAAAAGKVAHDAALQAKMMADEALSSGGYGNPNQINGFSLSDSMNISATSTPAPILNSDDGTNSSTSIIIAAKEAARRRVEAASAASKRAENLDAIVKAAELAEEAVSQAGKIVCMGDPLPLKELVEHGPAGYWKVPQVSSDLVVKPKSANSEQLQRDSAGEDPNISTKHSEGPSADKETSTINHEKPTPQKISTESKEDCVRLIDGTAGSTAASEKKSRRQKGRKGSGMSKTTSVVPESEIGLGSTSIDAYSIGEKCAQFSRDTSIKEGSQVEVFKNDERFKAAWYPANVLSLKDGKAYVGYKELISDEGPVKEWVALEEEGHEYPVIRLARPMTDVQFEGTRKRRRVAMGDYCWSVGDRVDALIQDSWWEGVVREKNKKDETSLTIHFPAQNETAVVRAWYLRPSLIWKDNEWIEWSCSVAKDPTSREGDTPNEKRLKMTTAVMEMKDKDEILISTDAGPGKTEEPRLPGLSTSDKVFNIGKNTRNETRTGTIRMARTGLQKERSRVVFGVPKPGKKRKFMDVSKHYVGDETRKNNEAKDSAKISKYLMPQTSGSRGWRNNSKTDLKEKQQVAEFKPKPRKSAKSLSVSSRTLRKNDTSAATASDSGTTVLDNPDQTRDYIELVDASRKHKTVEFSSFSSNEGAVKGPLLYSSGSFQSHALSKKASTSDAKSERANKGKLAPAVAVGKLPKIDEGKSAKSGPEVVLEPRRSVRRIQPTSRLLEGLQSSLIISKIPSILHDRIHKNKNASSSSSSSRGNNNG